MADQAIAQDNAIERGDVSPETLNVWFPNVELGFVPFGSRVVVQIKRPLSVSAGGIIYSEGALETELHNTQIGRIVAMGPLAYHNRATLEEWPERQWCKIGDIVRVPKHSQIEFFTLKGPDGDKVEFRLFDDTAILGMVVSDLSRFRAFL